MKLTHVRLLVSDMRASYRFYRHALDLPTTQEENPAYAEFEVGPDLAIAVEVSDPVDRSDWGIRVAHLRDPDGNLIELYHDIEWVRE